MLMEKFSWLAMSVTSPFAKLVSMMRSKRAVKFACGVEFPIKVVFSMHILLLLVNLFVFYVYVLSLWIL